jgi:hypothetical protein
LDNVDGLAGILGCLVSFLPLKYFGLPLGPSMKQIIFGTVLLRRKSFGWLVEK